MFRGNRKGHRTVNATAAPLLMEARRPHLVGTAPDWYIPLAQVGYLLFLLGAGGHHETVSQVL
eukprot:scaffold84965_cov46-Prasinocladus_malaysianus.AAC.1